MTVIDELVVRLRYLLFAALTAALLAAVIYGLAHRPPQVVLTIVPPAPAAAPTATPVPRPIRVHVAGAVAHPGVYTLPAAADVYDAIQAAGGPDRSADLERLNLAAAAQDAQQILVPRQQAVLTPEGSVLPGDSGAVRPPVDINTADKESLEGLPGIGPVLADRIITYRQTNGPFSTVNDLLAVKGIGEATLEELRPWITLEP